jgi:outer membrane protein assembly factor BamB
MTQTAPIHPSIPVEPFVLPHARGWRMRLPGGRALATPAIAQGRVFLGGGFGSREFYAFDARSGQLAWARSLSDDGPSAASVAHGRVAFTTESCTLFVIDAASGELCWARWLGDPLLAQPALDALAVYAVYPTSGHHLLAAFALGDGRVLWQAPLSSDAMSAPVLAGDSVYVATFDGAVARHARDSGRCHWRREMQATSAPWVVDGEVHVAQRLGDARHTPSEGFSSLSPTGAYSAVMRSSQHAPYLDARVVERSGYTPFLRRDDATVGFATPPASARTETARANVGHGTVRGLWEYQGSRPLVAGNTSYVSHGHSLRCFDMKSGRAHWESVLPGDAAALGGHLGAPPALAGPSLVVATAAGDIARFERLSGRCEARIALGEPLRFQPAVVLGRIYAATSFGGFFCIETGDAGLDGWPMWGGGPGHNGAA